MGKYVENNLQKNESLVKQAKITFIWVIWHITNILIIPLIVRIIKHNHIELAITNKRIVGKIGVFNTKSLDSPLNKIQNCSVKQTFGGKIFNFGTVVVNTAAGEYCFEGVKSANDFKNAVMAQIEQYEEDRTRQQAEQMARAMAGAINK